MQGFKVGFNNAYAKGIGKSKFVKEFKDIYPNLDLEAEYDKIVPPKDEKPKNGK